MEFRGREHSVADCVLRAFLALGLERSRRWLLCSRRPGSHATGISAEAGIRIAEQREGRNAGQVLANLAVASAGALIFGVTGNEVWVVSGRGFGGSCYRYCGQRGWSIAAAGRVDDYDRRAGLRAGTDGGIADFGTLAGLAAGAAIAGMACACGMVCRALDVDSGSGPGFVGMLADSVMGATIQRRQVDRQSGSEFCGYVDRGVDGVWDCDDDEINPRFRYEIANFS